MLRSIWDDLTEINPMFPRYWPGVADGRLLPSTEIYTENGDLIVRLELAGINPQKDVKVTVENHELVIRGERKRETEAKDKVYYRRETAYGAFERRVPLPGNVDEQSIKAEYKDGFLQITMKGAAKAMAADGEKTRVIPITTSAEPKKVEAGA